MRRNPYRRKLYVYNVTWMQEGRRCNYPAGDAERALEQAKHAIELGYKKVKIEICKVQDWQNSYAGLFNSKETHCDNEKRG